MNTLAILTCLFAAAAQGQGPTKADHAELAQIGLKVVHGQLVDINTPRPASHAVRRPGIRQGGPVCYWLFGNLLQWPEYIEPGIDEYTSFEPSYDVANSGVTSYFSDSVIQAPVVPIIAPLYSIQRTEKPITVTQITVFEPGKEQFAPPVVVKPSNPTPVSEPESFWLLLVGIFTLGIAKGRKYVNANALYALNVY